MAFDPISASILAGGTLLGGLFGDDEQEVTTTNVPWGPQAAALQNLYGEAWNAYQGGWPGFYPGPTYYMPTPLELQGREQQAQYAGQLPGMIDPLQESWMNAATGGEMNPYLQDLLGDLEASYGRLWNEQINPGLIGGAVDAGGYDSSRLGVAQAQGAGNLADRFGADATQLLANAYGQNLGQQRAAWGYAPQMLGFGLMPGQIGQQIGQQYGQDLFNMTQADRERWEHEQMAPFNAVGWYGQTIGGLPTFGQQTQAKPMSPWSTGLGLGMMGARLWDQWWNSPQTYAQAMPDFTTGSGLGISFPG